VTTGLTTGNWQGTLGSTAPNAIYGSINQSGSTSSSGQFTTSVFHITLPCYAATQVPDVPAQGFVNGTSVSLSSFTVNSQNLVLTATANAAGTSMSGTYSIYGGCGNGAQGAFNAIKYSDVTGNYVFTLNSSASQAVAAKAALTQNASDDGGGNFELSGTATFTGISCFTSGTITPSNTSVISGSNYSSVFLTNESGATSHITLTGNIDQGATTISNVTYTITGGGCSGQTGTGTATLSQ
jgi:hypothetical protein